MNLQTVKLVAILVAGLGLVWLGYRAGSSGTESHIKESESKYTSLLAKYELLKSEHEKTVKLLSAVKTTVKTKETRPDGTVNETETSTETVEKSETTTRETNESVKEEIASEDKTDSKSDRDVVVESNNARKVQYRVGADYRHSWTSGRETYLSVGARLGGTPLWLDVRGETKRRAVMVGLSFEW